MRLGLRNEPVKISGIGGLEPHLRGAGSRSLGQLNDRLQQRRRLMTVDHCGFCHTARHAVGADQDFSFDLFGSVPMSIPDRHRQRFIARLKLD